MAAIEQLDTEVRLLQIKIPASLAFRVDLICADTGESRTAYVKRVLEEASARDAQGLLAKIATRLDQAS